MLINLRAYLELLIDFLVCHTMVLTYLFVHAYNWRKYLNVHYLAQMSGITIVAFQSWRYKCYDIKKFVYNLKLFIIYYSSFLCSLRLNDCSVYVVPTLRFLVMKWWFYFYRVRINQAYQKLAISFHMAWKSLKGDTF